MPGAAFFDLDKTLMQGSSAFQFARAVREAGMISRRRLIGDGVANLRYRLRGASDDESEALRNRIAASLEGIRVRDMDRLSVRVMHRILPRLYPEMLTIAYAHQDAGRSAYVVTAAANDMAVLLARVMTFDGAIGSHLSEVEDGVYNGRPTGTFMYKAAKAVAIRDMAERDGYDLADSYAYSDSISDLPMLETVGHPVAVNPDRALATVAREQGWEIMRFDRLGRKLGVAGALSVAAVAGGATATALTRKRAQREAEAAVERRLRLPAPPLLRSR
jgi:HAD superfamily hydrolase (TIGR01490 family)